MVEVVGVQLLGHPAFYKIVALARRHIVVEPVRLVMASGSNTRKLSNLEISIHKLISACNDQVRSIPATNASSSIG